MEITIDQKIEILKIAAIPERYPGEVLTIEKTVKNYNELIKAVVQSPALPQP